MKIMKSNLISTYDWNQYWSPKTHICWHFHQQQKKCWMKLDCAFYRDKTLSHETHIDLHFINKWKSLGLNPMAHIHTIERIFNNTFNDY